MVEHMIPATQRILDAYAIGRSCFTESWKRSAPILKALAYVVRLDIIR